MLSFESLPGLLHLRDGLSVVGAKVDPSEESVTFILAGEGLRPTPRKCPVLQYRLSELMTSEF